jgi:hypothetical protein
MVIINDAGQIDFTFVANGSNSMLFPWVWLLYIKGSIVTRIDFLEHFLDRALYNIVHLGDIQC